MERAVSESEMARDGPHCYTAAHQNFLLTWAQHPHDLMERTATVSQPAKFLEIYSLPIGLLLMFALTWPLYAQLGLFVGYGLSLAALIMTGLTQGTAGVRSILGRFLVWRVGLSWYLVVLFLLAAFARSGRNRALCRLAPRRPGLRPDRSLSHIRPEPQSLAFRNSILPHRPLHKWRRAGLAWLYRLVIAPLGPA